MDHLDENDFFRQVTTRICGSLQIERALWQSLLYLKGFMPVDAISLHAYEHDLGALRRIASATASGGKKSERISRVSRRAWAELEGSKAPPVRIVNDLEPDPVGREIFQVCGDPNSSCLSLLPTLDGEILGAVVLVAKGREKYSERHARLLSLLNEPFAIALSRAHRYPESPGIKDGVADDRTNFHRKPPEGSGRKVIGGELGLKSVMEMVRMVSPINSPVLLLGETGVGKEVIARYIHSLSPRSGGPFVKVDCGAIPGTLIDSELFGHEKGAFTGALSQKQGRFERANRGTIFLDEIGELPPEAQIRMLRVIQDKEIERVGGSGPVSVDIRIIAATHRNLEGMVKSNHFRKDLWFRLNVFPIMIPPLRDRKEDIPALVHHFVEGKSAEFGLHTPPALSPGAVGRLISYHWPGNVRELENVVERTLVLDKEGPLKFERSLILPQKDERSVSPLPEAAPQKLDEAIYGHIVRALKMAKGKIHGRGGAAEILGINPSTLRNRMNKLGIRYGRQK